MEQRCRDFEQLLKDKENELLEKERHLNEIMAQMEADRSRINEEKTQMEKQQRMQWFKQEFDDQSLNQFQVSKPYTSPDPLRNHSGKNDDDGK